MFGMNPLQMRKLMKALKTENINATRVIIETDKGKIIIGQPKVTTVQFQGQKTYTIMGNEKVESEEDSSEVSEQDILLVKEKTGKSYGEAKKALEDSNNDIALAIKKLSEK